MFLIFGKMISIEKAFTRRKGQQSRSPGDDVASAHMFCEEVAELNDQRRNSKLTTQRMTVEI